MQRDSFVSITDSFRGFALDGNLTIVFLADAEEFMLQNWFVFQVVVINILKVDCFSGFTVCCCK